MYESGEDREIVNRVKNGVRTDVTGADRWFAAQSQLRLGLRNDAISDLTALTQTAGDPDVQVAAQLAIGRLTNDEATLAQALAAAGALPTRLAAPGLLAAQPPDPIQDLVGDVLEHVEDAQLVFRPGPDLAHGVGLGRRKRQGEISGALRDPVGGVHAVTRRIVRACPVIARPSWRPR